MTYSGSAETKQLCYAEKKSLEVVSCLESEVSVKKLKQQYYIQV